MLAPGSSYAGRYYDPWCVEDSALRGTRWTTPDPMLELYPDWSPYSYGLDNPLSNIDPSGDTTYAYNQNHELVPIDNSPDMISWGRQDPNYVSGNFTWFTDFNWVMVDPIYGRFHNMRTQIIPTANGARWYEPKPTVNMGIFDLPIGPGAEEESINITERALQHILEGHLEGGMESAGNSLFTVGKEEIVQLIKDAGSVSPVEQTGGNFERVINAGRTIGVDRSTGAPTSVYTVITSPSGNLVTAFPGKP